MSSGTLQREEGVKDSITELRSLMGGKHITNNSEGNSQISGSLSGRIAKSFFFTEKKKKPAIDSEIGKIKEALSVFPTESQEWKELDRKETIRKK